MVPMQRVLKYHLLLQVHMAGGLLGSVTMALAYLPPCVTGVGVGLLEGSVGPCPGLLGQQEEEEGAGGSGLFGRTPRRKRQV